MKPADAPCLAGEAVAVPGYLRDTYWWAYVDPRAVRLFERQWLVNLILWGNFGRLRDAALDALGSSLQGRTLQIACVYGDLTQKLLERHAGGAELDVLDVLPVQLGNLAGKLPPRAPVGLIHGDSTQMPLASASYDRAVLFFLLHEQPDDARRATLAEALRVVKAGGSLVIVDYHRPHRSHPLYYPMMAILRTLEPFALDLWRHELAEWLPHKVRKLKKDIAFGGLYQVVRITA